LSGLFRAQFRDRLQQTDLFPLVDARVWHKAWVVHCEPVGSGQEAFRYLARDIFRVAISHHPILTLEDGHVTVQDNESATGQTTSSTVTAEEFLRRFLQHVLPDNFIKVRYDGFLSPGNRPVRTKARAVLGATPLDTTPPPQPAEVNAPPEGHETPRCPTCGRILILVETLRRRSRWPPCSWTDRLPCPLS
jgi:hypothetical protein